MTIDELAGRVRDALRINSLRAAQIAARVRAQTNETDPERLLVAALEVAHDQVRQITELERELEDSETERAVLEQDVEALRVNAEALRADLEELRSAAP